jgi:hypothetical protein
VRRRSRRPARNTASADRKSVGVGIRDWTPGHSKSTTAAVFLTFPSVIDTITVGRSCRKIAKDDHETHSFLIGTVIAFTQASESIPFRSGDCRIGVEGIND